MFFRGKYAFLSNMYECIVNVKINGKVYSFKCGEALYQVQKDISRIEEFLNLNGVDAKKLGATIRVNRDWANGLSEEAMYIAEKAKYDSNPFLKDKLISIKEPIIEENNHKDIVWGVYKGYGQNKLGKILQGLRDEYIKELSLIGTVHTDRR